MSAHTDDFHERLEVLARAVVETRSAYHLGENGPDGLDLSFAYDDAVSAFHRASHPHENTILKLIAERDALRAGLEEIINECPASCETSPAHNMADIARQLLTPRSETPDNLMEGEK